LTSTHKRSGTQDTDAPKRFSHIPLTPAHIAQLADYVENTQHSKVYALALRFCAYTGLRAAELAGLQISDLTLSEIPGTAGAVSVERTKTKCEGQWNTDSPKTKESVRTVPLEAWLADGLRDYLSQHPCAGEVCAPLFVGHDGRSPIDCANVYKRYMQPALAALSLPAARFHDLRHSFAVNLLSATPPVDFKRVSKWLGHSTFTLTLDTYGDYINPDVSLPAGLARPVASAKDRADNVVPIDRASG
jgi:integrase